MTLSVLIHLLQNSCTCSEGKRENVNSNWRKRVFTGNRNHDSLLLTVPHAHNTAFSVAHFAITCNPSYK
jgi:hypothetical protein